MRNRKIASIIALVLCAMMLLAGEVFASNYYPPIYVPNGYWGDWTEDGGYKHDIVASNIYGTPVYAIDDGTITCEQKIGTQGVTSKGISCKDKFVSYGNIAYFTSTDGKTTARYAHLSEFAKCSTPSWESAGYGSTYDISYPRTYSLGEFYVKKGEVIGYVGSTGNSSGPHLHFELRINGKRVHADQYVAINEYVEPEPDLPWDGPAILTNTDIDQIKVYTLENRRYYNLYSDKNLGNKKSDSAWTGEDDEDWILGVGKNSNGVYYARISYPTQNGRLTAYVNLRELFVAGWLSEYVPIYKDCNEFYNRRGSGYTNSYWARVADGAIFPLARDSQYVQVLFWDSGDNGGRRIAWLTRSKYNEITTPPQTTNPPVVQAPQAQNDWLQAITGQYFYKKLSATNSPTSWAISTATLPPGLNFNASTGVISGTPARTDAGDLDQNYTGMRYTCYVTAKNSGGTSAPEEVRILVWQSPQITTNSTLPNAFINTPYSMQIFANGSKMGMSWKLKSGTLPPGLSLDGDSQEVRSSGSRYATISGTPTTTGTYTFTMEVMAGSENLINLTPPAGKIATKTFTITIKKPVPVIQNTTSLSSLKTVTGQYFSKSLSATNNPTSWAISSGSLPTGISLNTSTGLISGTASRTDAGNSDANYAGITYTCYVTAKNSGGSSSPAKVSINVEQAPQITTGSTLPAGVINTAYNTQLYANGTRYRMHWTIVSGALPPGLSLFQSSSASGSRTATISGKPTKSGTYTFTVEVVAGAGAAGGSPLEAMKARKTFTITVIQPAISGSFSSSGIVSTAYSGSATVSGGKADYTWTYTGVPTGLKCTVSGAKITLSGKPTKAGTYTLKLTAKDASGNVATKNFSIKIDVKPAITTKTLPKAVIGEAYQVSVKASGTSLTWQMSWVGKKISGLTFNTSNGTIKGKPSTNSKVGTYKVKVTAKNSAGAVSKTLTIKLSKPAKPKFTTKTLANAVMGKKYTQTIKASGSSITWQMSWVGKKIKGLSFNTKKALISGKPATSNEAGTYKIKIIAKNTGGSVSKTFAIKLTAKVVKKSDTLRNTAAKISRLVKNKPQSDTESKPEVSIAIGSSSGSSQVHKNKSPSGVIQTINRSTNQITGALITIEGRKYIIASVFDAISVNESGQYDLSAEIHEDIETGAKLIWIANPINADYSEDDEIADFYDEESRPIEEVPDSHLIIVSPWLRADVIYEPVIVIEAE